MISSYKDLNTEDVYCISLVIGQNVSRQLATSSENLVASTLPWSQRFFFIFLRMREPQVAKRRERKTSGYLGLESHFHADARVRI